MNKNIIALTLGLITSVVGGYLYSYLIKVSFPFVYVVGTVLVIMGLGFVLYVLRGRLFLLFTSGIVGYYPKGQIAFIKKAVSEILKSREVIIIGARGMDLTGENSPVGNALKESTSLNNVEIFLLEPGGKNSRLRSEHLEVEKRKYEAECVSVDNFIGLLKIRDSKPIKKYSYTVKPLFRLIITDYSAFLSFYKSGIRGRDLPCWHISRKSTSLFPQIIRYLDYMKNNSEVKAYNGERKEVKTEAQKVKDD